MFARLSVCLSFFLSFFLSFCCNYMTLRNSSVNFSRVQITFFFLCRQHHEAIKNILIWTQYILAISILLLLLLLLLIYEALRKHAYSNTLRILPPKYENFRMKNSGSFHSSAQNIDCGYLLDPPRRGVLMSIHNLCLRGEIRKLMYTPENPSFTV